MGYVYLIPSLLAEESNRALPSYLLDAIKDCDVFFVENERTTRRYFKQLWKEMIIDDYEWHVMDEPQQTAKNFRACIKGGKRIGIVSDAGCPGIADPGQQLVAIAQELSVKVRPLVGPSSILLALMASGMNGQKFQFHGYLPIDTQARIKAIRELEQASQKQDCTQVFIETPYRNNQLIETMLQHAHPSTKLCIAVDITGKQESIITKSVEEWKKNKPDIHKRTAIFLLYAGHPSS